MKSAVHTLALESPVAMSALTRSFEELYVAHFHFVWRTLRRLGVPSAQVEDAAQDTFVVVHRRLDGLRCVASEKAWLFGIARRVAADYRRNLRRRGTVSLDQDLVPSPDAGPFEGTAKGQAARLLERFLASLDDDKRAVFVLVELEHMSAPEVAEALDVNVHTVYSRLRPARARFVAFLHAQGGHDG